MQLLATAAGGSIYECSCKMRCVVNQQGKHWMRAISNMAGITKEGLKRRIEWAAMREAD